LGEAGGDTKAGIGEATERGKAEDFIAAFGDGGLNIGEWMYLL
jgi:hypothetical protein